MITKGLPCGCSVEVTKTDCWIVIYKGENCIIPNHKTPYQIRQSEICERCNTKLVSIPCSAGADAGGYVEDHDYCKTCELCIRQSTFGINPKVLFFRHEECAEEKKEMGW